MDSVPSAVSLPIVGRPLSASIEILPRQLLPSDQLATLLPVGTRVYLTDLGGPENTAEMLRAARRLKEAGHTPVPHLAARRVPNREALERHLGQLVDLAGVDDVLVIGGSVASPIGPYSSAMRLLDTGILHQFGINNIAVAGHPEGSPDFTEASAIHALKQKHAFAERFGAHLRIVTQFGFDPARTLAWAEHLTKIGIDSPIHIGVAGPANLPTLIKYATLCGVGNSLSLLTKNPRSLFSLTTGYAPDDFVTPIEAHLSSQQRPTIAQMHIFPFGGLEQASNWLRARGSW